MPGDESGLDSTVDETNRARLANEKVVGDLADGRSEGIIVGAHHQEQLVLCGRQVRIQRTLLAPMQEAAQPVAKGQ